jgi:PAS domain S-box-containing protein
MLKEIHDHRQTEKTLRENEERYRAVYEGMPVGIVETDFDGVIMGFNKAAEKIFGCSAEEAIGNDLRMLMPEGRVEKYGVDLTEFFKREVVPYVGQQKEAIGRRANGEEFPMLGGAGEYTAGGKRFLILMSLDQTDYKAMEQKLMRAQRMEAIGQLTGGIAHDFNNILGITIGNLELLEEEAKDYPQFVRRVHAALKGAHRGSEITRKLLSFSRGPQSRGEKVSINDVLNEMLPLLSQSLTASIRVKPHLGKDIWPVLIDRGDLQDGVLNLALNARDAMSAGGTIVIETENRTVEEDVVHEHGLLKRGDYAVISVSDSGVGMPDDVRARVFEPFYSTKAEGKGTGLGLSMVYGFVKGSGGHIDVYSEVGKGTTFRIYLPRATSSKLAAAASDDSMPVPNGNEKILIVDDEEGLLDIAAEFLTSLGYRVLMASSQVDALRILEGDEHIDLLFTDIVLPGHMDGYGLAEAAHKLRPGIRILAASGFSKRWKAADDDDSKPPSDLVQSLLVKPYSRKDLARAVRRALDQNSKEPGREGLRKTDA